MATESVKEKIKNLGLTEYSQMAMTRYGKAVNEDRALGKNPHTPEMDLVVGELLRFQLSPAGREKVKQRMRL